MKTLQKVIILFYSGFSIVFATNTIEHEVKNGETLYTVAHKYHTSIEEVARSNDLDINTVIKAGRVLKVPVNTYFPDERLILYKVQEGDVLSIIAKKHHTTSNLLKELNGLKEKDTIKVGATLKIPKHTYLAKNSIEETKVSAIRIKKPKHAKSRHVSKEKTGTYHIQKGDTLFTIAKKHKMMVAELLKINQIDYKSTLKVGQTLKVFSGKSKTVTHKNIASSNTHHKKHRIVRKSRKSDRILKNVLKKQAKPLASRRIKQYAVKSDDIFFRTMGSALKPFGKNRQSKIISLAKQKLGRKYVWGASGQNAFDCSGLTTYVYKKNGIILPRRAIAQSKVGKRIGRNQLKPGDLVFFDTSKQHRGFVNHVGIYIGNGKFIHASSAKKKVVITSLNKPFYAQRFKGARRLSSSS